MKRITDFKSFVFSPLLIYIIRCALGFSIGYLLMLEFPQFDFFWALLSIMLVISPEGKDSPKLTRERVKANLVGAFSGIVVVFLPWDLYFRILLGIVLAALLSKLFKLMNVARTAIVGIVIILIEKPNDGFWASIERFSAVLIGCLIGLLVVVVTGFFIRKIHAFWYRLHLRLRK